MSIMNVINSRHDNPFQTDFSPVTCHSINEEPLSYQVGDSSPSPKKSRLSPIPNENISSKIIKEDDCASICNSTEDEIKTRPSSINYGNLPTEYQSSFEDDPSVGDGGAGKVTLWQFLLELLLSNKYAHLIRWTNNEGEFVLLQAEEVAKLWGLRKDKNHRMNYDKLSRALRYYYQKNIIRKVHGHKFVYQFIGLKGIFQNGVPTNSDITSIESLPLQQPNEPEDKRPYKVRQKANASSSLSVGFNTPGKIISDISSLPILGNIANFSIPANIQDNVTKSSDLLSSKEHLGDLSSILLEMSKIVAWQNTLFGGLNPHQNPPVISSSESQPEKVSVENERMFSNMTDLNQNGFHTKPLTSTIEPIWLKLIQNLMLVNSKNSQSNELLVNMPEEKLSKPASIPEISSNVTRSRPRSPNCYCSCHCHEDRVTRVRSPNEFKQNVLSQQECQFESLGSRKPSSGHESPSEESWKSASNTQENMIDHGVILHHQRHVINMQRLNEQIMLHSKNISQAPRTPSLNLASSPKPSNVQMSVEDETRPPSQVDPASSPDEADRQGNCVWMPVPMGMLNQWLGMLNNQKLVTDNNLPAWKPSQIIDRKNLSL